MAGRIKRKLLQGRSPDRDEPEAVICALCGRPVPASQRDEHHLVPKSEGGKLTVTLHRICHRQIHALLTESELAASYASPEALLSHPELARFVRWVRTKPDGFYERTRKSHRIRRSG